jgi:hypothetical protein
MAPPDEKFWQKYSPHYEFPLSSIGSVAMHIGFLLVFILLLWLLAKMTVSDKTPVPMTEMAITGDGDGPGKVGGEGAPLEERGDPKVQRTPQRLAPQAELPGLVLTPPRKSAGGEGDGPHAGKGPGPSGSGANAEGDGPASSGSRSKRWELIFRTQDGKDYLAQLAAMKATLVIPTPPNWNVYKMYKNLHQEKPAGVAFSRDELPGLYFVDDAADSAGKIAAALGLDYSPPLFIAFFPKDIEDQLAAKERTYRGLSEDRIASTKFKILMRDGKPTITVVDQIASGR